MMNIIDVDGHKAAISFDPDIGMLRGEFLGLSGGADFYAKDVDQLLTEARKSFQTYLDICSESGVAPFREFSGRFNVRLDPSTHEAAVVAAAAENKSLNEWVADAIRTAAHA